MRSYGSLAGKKRLHYGEYVHRIDLPSEKKVLSIAITAKIDPSSIEVKVHRLKFPAPHSSLRQGHRTATLAESPTTSLASITLALPRPVARST